LSSPAPATFWKKSLRWLPGVVISLAALFFLSRLVQWEDLGPALSRFGWIHFGGMIGLTLVFLILRAVVSRVLLSGKPTFMDAFWVINQGYLLNNILPFRLGEIGRAVLLGQRINLPASQVLPSIVVERVMDIAIAAGMLLATLPRALELAWAKSAALIMLIVVVIALAGLFLMAHYHEVVAGWVDRLGTRSKFLGRWIVPQIQALLNGFSALTNIRQFLLAFLVLAASWMVAVGIYFIALRALSPQAPFRWGIFTDSVLALGIAIPSAPASLGTFEAAVVGALAILKIDQTSALAYAITVHFVQILVTGILGMAGFIRQGRSISKVFRDLQVRKEAA
jgi:uncharacterized protein (TIRG00374 family)